MFSVVQLHHCRYTTHYIIVSTSVYLKRRHNHAYVKQHLLSGLHPPVMRKLALPTPARPSAPLLLACWSKANSSSCWTHQLSDQLAGTVLNITSAWQGIPGHSHLSNSMQCKGVVSTLLDQQQKFGYNGLEWQNASCCRLSHRGRLDQGVAAALAYLCEPRKRRNSALERGPRFSASIPVSASHACLPVPIGGISFAQGDLVIGPPTTDPTSTPDRNTRNTPTQFV